MKNDFFFMFRVQKQALWNDLRLRDEQRGITRTEGCYVNFIYTNLTGFVCILNIYLLPFLHLSLSINVFFCCPFFLLMTFLLLLTIQVRFSRLLYVHNTCLLFSLLKGKPYIDKRIK